MLRDKNMDLNYFKSDVLFDAVEDYSLYFQDTRDIKGDISKTKYCLHEK